MQTVSLITAPTAGPLARRAADELGEYLVKLWRVRVDRALSAPDPAAGDSDVVVTLGLAGDHHIREELQRLSLTAQPVGAQAFALRSSGNQIIVAGSDDHGVLYGAYELLECLGARFYLSGTSLPRPTEPQVPDLDVDASPAVALRGYMPYTDFLTGPSAWDTEDYVASIDAAARLRLNLFSMHFYSFEPVGAFEFKGRRRTEAFWDTSRTSRWRKKAGRLSDMRVGQELFSAYRGSDTFGARSALQARDADDRFRLAEADIQAAFALARERGMTTTIGIEVTDPPLEFRALVDPQYRFGPDRFGICPSSPDARELLGNWLRALVETFPLVDVYSLWQTESGPSRWTPGCPCADCVAFRNTHPLPRYAVEDLLGKVSGDNYHVEDIRESAQTFLQWVLLGYDILQEIAPGKQVALAGWYIEHLFSAAAAYLPPDLVLTSMTEVDPWEAPPLLDHYAGVPQRRWLINWWEIDFRMWLPQPKVSAYPPIIAKMLEHQIEGVIWQHWRTRSVDDNARYTALAMWNPALTPDEYYRDAFGVEWGPAAAVEATEAMRLFEEYERWLCHDLGWEIFAQDWFPPTMCLALEYLGVHGPVPARVIDEVTAKLADVDAIRARLTAVHQGLRRARSLAIPLRDGDRPGFWENRVEYYLLFIECLEKIGSALLSYDEATRTRRPGSQAPQALARTYELLSAAPVVPFLEKLAARVEDKGDLGTLVNLNNELWARYRQAMDCVASWVDELGIGWQWVLRGRPDGSLRPPIVGPDALTLHGQWTSGPWSS